jgi:hypothetical protein
MRYFAWSVALSYEGSIVFIQQAEKSSSLLTDCITQRVFGAAQIPMKSRGLTTRGWSRTQNDTQQNKRGKPWSQESRKKLSKSKKDLFRDSDMAIRISGATSGIPKRCSICAGTGHNALSCLKKVDDFEYMIRLIQRVYTCKVCGQPGHNMRACLETNPSRAVMKSRSAVIKWRCSNCAEFGHTKRTCTKPPKAKRLLPLGRLRNIKMCSLCGEGGHTKRRCTSSATLRSVLRSTSLLSHDPYSDELGQKLKVFPFKTKTVQEGVPRCSLCGNPGRNRISCSSGLGKVRVSSSSQFLLSDVRKCKHCRKPGHNMRTCENNKSTQVFSDILSLLE